MSIFGALQSSVSGLAAQSNALGMISDNISNVNTVGYKETRASFETLVTQAATRTSFSPGGVRSRPMQQIDQQGLLQSSDSRTDIAVSGNGFFVVNERANPQIGDDFLFTRAGEFRADQDGNLVNSSGFFLQGWPLDNEGNLPAARESIDSLETVNISGLSGLPRATSEIELGANLPSTAADGEQHSMTVQIFDVLGNAHNMTVDYVYNEADDAWDVTINQPELALDPGTPSGEFDSTAAGVPITGQVAFNGDGSLASVDPALTDFTITDWTTGANDSDIDLDLGDIDGLNGLTSFSSDFTVTEINQNGLRFGNFTGVNIDEEGIVTAIFDNGRRRDLFQLPVATFNNPNGLEAVSGNAYLRSDLSGEVLLNQAGVGGAGDIAPGALEGSTVDLANEFTDLITTQRAYSAATRIISTSDEMLQELTQATR